MISVKTFTVNPFMINTYLLYDESGEAVVVDAGFSNSREEKTFLDYIEQNNLNPVRLLNTHCHIDHVWGNQFISKKFNLKVEAHALEKYNNEGALAYASVFGVSIPQPPAIELFLQDGDMIQFGKSRLQVLFTPGHSSGHICFYSELDRILLSGDTLFSSSIGRTDLPGGDYTTIINSINTKLMILNDDIRVFPGHNESTTIGQERRYNPFLTD